MKTFKAASRRARGEMAYHGGLAAEHCVAREYEMRGYAIARRRWRGQGGEIDMILSNENGLVFVEVKKARTFANAAESLTPRQMRRIHTAAEEYLGGEPAGTLTEVRFDVAMVDASGQTRIIENAFGHC